jgi:hypothetical protein
MRTSRSGTGKTWQVRLQQAQQRGFDRLQAIAGAAGLLRELERYVARRERQGRHTDFDEMLEACLPGLALAIALLRGQDEAVESADVQQRWGEISPELSGVLRPFAATFGLEVADRLVAAFRTEVDRELARRAKERDDLVDELMEWAAKRGFPRFRCDDMDVPEGLDAWSAFCGDAALEQLRAVAQTIRLRKQAQNGRLRLAELSGE